jgi:putative endonuclease
MPFYVYIIESAIDGSFYKGFSENPIIRLQQHNQAQTTSTRHLIPWKLIYIEEIFQKKLP